MHTTIAAAADWQFEASLSEANCKRVREYWSTMLQKNEKNVLCGAPFLHVRPNMRNMPKSTSDPALCFILVYNCGLTVRNKRYTPPGCLSVCLSVCHP